MSNDTDPRRNCKDPGEIFLELFIGPDPPARAARIHGLPDHRPGSLAYLPGLIPCPSIAIRSHALAHAMPRIMPVLLGDY